MLKKIIFDLGYVTIRGTNSCNRDVRDMGTQEHTYSFVITAEHDTQE